MEEIGGYKCIRRRKWIRADACSSDDANFVLDSQREAAYNSSSAIRGRWNNNPPQSASWALNVINELPDGRAMAIGPRRPDAHAVVASMEGLMGTGP